MKKNNNVKLVAFISLISVVLLASSATFAWFFANSDVEVDYGSEIVCETGSSLEISVYKGIDENNQEVWSEWSTSLTIEKPSAKLQDVTGDGINLYTPSGLETINGVLTPVKFSTSQPMDKDGFGDFIEIDLKVRSTSPMNVYFADESFILPYDLEKDITNVYGDFSQDYIAGAMRLAVIEQVDDSTQDLKMIWAPNATYELNKKNDGKYLFNENGSVEDYKYYRCIDAENSIFELHEVDIDEIANNKFVVDSTKTTDVMVNQSPLLAKLVPDNSGFGEARLTVKVWFEGCDREANEALSGGSCKMKFVFSGMEAKDEALQSIKDSINAITYTTSIQTIEDTIIYNTSWNSVPNGILYTIDGYNWVKYDQSQNNLPNLYAQVMQSKQSKRIYFKSEETLDYYSYMNYIEIPYIEGGE